MSESDPPVEPHEDGPVHPEYAPAPETVPPGWYHDPVLDQLRWWDGVQWTDAVAPAGHPSAGNSEPVTVQASGSTVVEPIPNTLSPPEPPAVKAPNTTRWITIGALALAVLLVGFFALRAIGGGSVEVDYTLMILGDCSGWGYNDVTQGSQVEVTDGSGDVLGFGDLVERGDCTYDATFTIDKSGDGVYRVTTGNQNRGYLSYSEDDISDGKLTVFATLGDLYE